MDLNILTQEEIQKAVDDAYLEYGRGIDPEVWNVFLHGTDDKYEKLHTQRVSWSTELDSASSVVCAPLV